MLSRLLLVSACVWGGGGGGAEISHSLTYCFYAVSEYGKQARLRVLGYVDDTPFVKFDSKATIPRVESITPWLELDNSQYFEKNTEKCKHLERNFGVHLKMAMGYYNQTDTKPHTLQLLLECNIGLDERFLSGHFQYAYDAKDHISLNDNLDTWVAANVAAQITKRKFEASNLQQKLKKYLEGECIEWLRRYLTNGNLSTYFVSPKVSITKHETHQNVTLKCWAWDFYPAKITLEWKNDNVNVTDLTEFVETRPLGNGTFEKWMAIVVQLGEEWKYSCHVHHHGVTFNYTLPQRFQTSIAKGPVAGGVGIVIIVSVLAVGGFTMWKFKNKRLKTNRRYDEVFVTDAEFE
ncbi:membrane protein A18 [Aotine betaherpesvirus 1]|uniref:Membrane protein A18 n=1 Tax=Aotine betaherpesvirus 1 TaxID=50290 RepID=G8XU93_9BETA|nr:membrane protein A18 [Aotine betaherpesvirus 1]AEV80724.1 membrane protein A18 [Aotine betaherpesvirus 1]